MLCLRQFCGKGDDMAGGKKGKGYDHPHAHAHGQVALEMAWEGCKAVYLSFDIDSIDPGSAPGTGSPEPGCLLPREAFEMIHTTAAEGLCGMEVVEVSPPYDVNDNTAQLACQVVLDLLGTLIANGHIGHRKKFMK